MEVAAREPVGEKKSCKTLIFMDLGLIRESLMRLEKLHLLLFFRSRTCQKHPGTPEIIPFIL